MKQLSVDPAGRNERAKCPLGCQGHAPRKHFFFKLNAFVGRNCLAGKCISAIYIHRIAGNIGGNYIWQIARKSSKIKIDGF